MLTYKSIPTQRTYKLFTTQAFVAILHNANKLLFCVAIRKLDPPMEKVAVGCSVAPNQKGFCVVGKCLCDRRSCIGLWPPLPSHCCACIFVLVKITPAQHPSIWILSKKSTSRISIKNEKKLRALSSRSFFSGQRNASSRVDPPQLTPRHAIPLK